MTERSDQAKEWANERYRILLDEAVEALPEVLRFKGKTRRGRSITQKRVCPLVAEQAKKSRHRDGIHSIPIVNGRGVRDLTTGFVRSNWSAICIACADDGNFIVWDDYKNDGIRLGTRDEYQMNSAAYKRSADGTVDKYNDRAAIIRRHGGVIGDLVPPILLEPPH